MPCYTGASNTQITGAWSSQLDDSGNATCAAGGTPTKAFTTNTLNADCAGHFKLCFTMKAGSSDNPKPTDCTVATVCTEGDYTAANQDQKMPDLPSWVATDSACAAAFAASGYAEFTVIGKSALCDDVGDHGNPLVFLRLPYCPLVCGQDPPPDTPECQACANGRTGSF
jgi:hypothetical protein